MLALFHYVSRHCSAITTEAYSTSFSSAIRLLYKDLRQPVHSIYGFVRFADEIVDTFHDFDRARLLQRFKQDTFAAIEQGISLNPILHSFQLAVHAFNIPLHLIEAFFRSMEMDLHIRRYSEEQYTTYIYGSAEVVGLMCLCLFCEGDAELYNKLEPAARSLGAAFQKVNFLRDMKADHFQLQRMYFPDVDFDNFTPATKQRIEKEIQADFRNAHDGILQLPWKAQFGVYVAYRYYLSLFNKISKLQPSGIGQQRVRISAYHKVLILVKARLRTRLNLI